MIVPSLSVLHSRNLREKLCESSDRERNSLLEKCPNTDQKKLHIWTLHAVIISKMNKQCLRIVSKVMTYSLALCTLFRKCLCLFNLKSSQLFAWKNIKKIWWCQKKQKQTLHCIKLSSNICYIDAANRIAILLTSLSLKKIEEDFNRKNWDQL